MSLQRAVLLLALQASNAYVINKCCPETEVLDDKLTCVEQDVPDYESEHLGKFSFFPVQVVVNSTTLNIHEFDQERILRHITTNYTIQYGWEGCGHVDEERILIFSAAHDIVTFHFLLYENGSMRVHMDDLGINQNELTFSTVNITSATPRTDIKAADITTFPLSGTCVDKVTNGAYVVKFCPCLSMRCVHKCCNTREVFDIQTSCTDMGAFDTLFDGISDWRPVSEKKTDDIFVLQNVMPGCAEGVTPYLLKTVSCYGESNEDQASYHLDANSSISVTKHGRQYKKPYDYSQYCGEITIDGEHMFYQNLLLCGGTPPTQIKESLYGVLVFLGAICLLATVLVSLFLPELRQRINNKIALSHNASLMVAYFVWGIQNLIPTAGTLELRIVLTLVFQFTFLASFFWLNVMCIDIAVAFSFTRSKCSDPSSENKKFLKYCLYAWGAPTLYMIFTLAMEFSPGVSESLRPGLQCFGGLNPNGYTMLTYFYGPMLVLLFINLCMFLFTALRILSVQRQTAILKKSDSVSSSTSQHSERQRLILYARLFVLMGLTWITEIISWWVGGSDYFWYFFDIFNLLRAVFIFVLFICKKSVLRRLRRRLMGQEDASRSEGSTALEGSRVTSGGGRQSKGEGRQSKGEGRQSKGEGRQSKGEGGQSKRRGRQRVSFDRTLERNKSALAMELSNVVRQPVGLEESDM